jgi:hypothetical protein
MISQLNHKRLDAASVSNDSSFLLFAEKATDTHEPLHYFLSQLSGYSENLSMMVRGSESDYIDNIRKAQRFIGLKQEVGTFRCLILEDMDKFSLPAINSCLKMIEEPIGSTIVVITTNNISALPSTIISRCHQIYISSNSHEQIELSSYSEALAVIAGDGITTAKLSKDIKSDRLRALLNELMQILKFASNNQLIESNIYTYDLELLMNLEDMLTKNVNTKLLFLRLILQLKPVSVTI